MDRRQEEDRRKVDRFSSPPIREHFRQINICVRFLTVLTFGGSVFCIVRGVATGGAVEISFGIFMGFIFALLTAFLYRYSVAIHDYLYNESVNNLDKAMERQSVFWIVTTFMAVVWTLVYFVFSA